MTNHTDSKSDSGSSSGSQTKSNTAGCLAQIITVLGFIFGCSGVIIAAILTSPTIKCLVLPYTCAPPPPTATPFFTPTFSSTPTISILNIQTGNEPVNREYAPQQVSVSVNVLNAKGYYLYLIVDDGKIEWIQDPLGLIGSDKYRTKGDCYLGDTKNPAPAMGKTFTIYAVLSSDGSYQEHDDFTGQPFLAMSNSISLVRRDLPTPTP